MRIEYIFTILFLALGPLGVIPVFDECTRGADRRYRLRVAATACAIAAGILAVVALLGAGTLANWHVSRAALEIAIGILLLRSTFTSIARLEGIMQKGANSASVAADLPAPAALAFSPIAAPTIVSATGVVTVALFLSLASGNPLLQTKIYAVLLFLLALDFAAMLAARPIMRFVRMPTLAIVGWIFAALQAALAVEVTLAGLRLAGFLPR